MSFNDGNITEQQSALQEQLLTILKMHFNERFEEITRLQTLDDSKFLQCDNSLQKIEEELARINETQKGLVEQMAIFNKRTLGDFNLGQKWVGGIIIFIFSVVIGISTPWIVISGETKAREFIQEQTLISNKKDIANHTTTLESVSKTQSELTSKITEQQISSKAHEASDNALLKNINENLTRLRELFNSMNDNLKTK